MTARPTRSHLSPNSTLSHPLAPEQVLEQITASNVRGRGGAGFAMGKKASFIPAGDMDKYLVCNADESEPGTFKDRELMAKKDRKSTRLNSSHANISYAVFCL